MYRDIRNVIGAGVSTFALVCGAPAFADTLSDAVGLAYLNNPNLRAVRAVQKQVDETLVQARAQYGVQSQITVSGTYQRVDGQFFRSMTNPQGVLSAESTSTALTLSQSLYSGGRLQGGVDLAKANILSQRENLRQTEIQVLQQVVGAYLAVRRDLQILQVYQDNVLALERLLAQVRAQFGVRQVTKTDVDQTIGRLALTRANLAGARAQLEISRSQYLQVVGENPGELAQEPALAVFADIDEAFTSAELNSPALNGARFEEQAARARVAQARAQFLPSVTAQVSVGRNPIEPYSSTLGDQTSVLATVQANQPLYRSGLYTSALRQAKGQVEEMTARIEVARRSAIQTVSQAWSQLAAARAQLVADDDGATATQAAFYGVRREQPFDLRQPIDVLNAEQDLNNAQVRFLQDRYNEYVARVNLLAAAGVLRVEMLTADVSSYRPEDHLKQVKDRGLPFYAPFIEALDSIGAPADPPPAVVVTGPEKRTAGQPALPAAPLPTTTPLRTATSIMESEEKEGVDGHAPSAPTNHCFDVGGRKIGDCVGPGPTFAKPPL